MKQLKAFFGILFLSLVTVACSNSSDSPEAVAKEFIEVFAQGDSKKMIDLIYISEEEDTPETKEMIAAKLGMLVQAAKQEMDQLGGIKSIEVNDVTYNGDKTTAKVALTVTYKNGEVNGPDDVDLIKTKKGWKVSFL